MQDSTQPHQSIDATTYDIGDHVRLGGTDILCDVAGVMCVLNDEDKYLLVYFDRCGNPKREWWPESELMDADVDDTDDNVIFVDFPRGAKR